ncbi:MAG: phosphoribosyltransferase [Bdellovibrionales bacterium]|nr:phosphoribosyltransferase [Bdellovibrionales bacterium]
MFFKTKHEPSDTSLNITAIPSSKSKRDLEYDYRFEDLFKELLEIRPSLNIEWPVENKDTVKASHHGGPRNPETIKKNYIWKGFKKSLDKIYIVDDVITTGAHFRAMCEFLTENGYKGKIVGLFWSRTVHT